MKRFALAVFALLLLVTPAMAQQIAAVRVEGTQRIEPATVISYLSVKQGDAFDSEAINTSLKTLFETGYFSDIQLLRENNDLIVKVVENPIINEIAFEGNDDVKVEELQNETQLRARVVYTRAKVQEDVQRLLQIYRRLGHYSASIDPKIIKLDQNRVNLVYEINEGEKTKVRSIKFVGNKKFSDDTLRDAVMTKESRWYRFLSSDDNYDQDRVAYDQELLRKFYLSKGYADFSVIASVAELTPDQKDFFITYTITEGERYKLGKVDLKNNLRGVKTDALQPSIKTVSGDWYNADKVDTTILAMTDLLANQQFAFAEVKPQVALEHDKRLVNLTYVINESPRVFVERINIDNNTRTLDAVIRREMLLVEGDPFNKLKLKKSEQRLKDLGYFKNVTIKTVPGSRPDQAIVNVSVEEQSTGELSIGAGFSTNNGPLGDFRIRERNLLGKGQDLQLATTISGRTQQYNLGFTEPYFMDRSLSAGVDLFHVETDYQDIGSFDQTRTGGGLRMGYPLSENWRHDVGYKLQNNDIRSVPATASFYVRSQQGKFMTSSVNHALTYSTLDSKLDPSEGSKVILSNELAGLGGDRRFLSTKLRGMHYWPITDDRSWVFSSMGELGYIFGFGQDTRINERYFLGGNDFRGFDIGGMGPRDLATNDALGGNQYALGTLELAAPLGGASKDLGLRSHFFTDVGTLSGLDTKGPTVVDNANLRLSVGAGLSWKSPMGPIRGDLAFPIMKEDYDETRTFNINFGTRF